MKPAMRPDEWNAVNVAGEHQPRIERAELQVTENENGLFIDRNSTHGVEWEPEWCSEIPEYKHALAAFCLNGQPFGFTWEDVDACRARADDFEARHDQTLDVGDYENMLYWRGLADRIEALLPPRDLS